MAKRPDSYSSMIAGLQDDGLSRTQIAKKSGLSKATVWRLANGANKNHFVDTITRVERVQQRAENISRVKRRKV